MKAQMMMLGMLTTGILASPALSANPAEEIKGASGRGMQSLATLQPGRTMRSSSSAADWKNDNLDARTVAPGETIVMADLKGPGEIRHIWNTIAPGELAYSRLMVVRMYWDGEEYPSVEVPLGDFFGVGHGLDRSFTSEPISVSSHGRARNCYWNMPFRKSAKITITNEGKKHALAFFWYVDWQQLPNIAENVGYFHAQYRQEHSTVMGRNYRIADIEGKGQYVGTLLNVRQRTPGWWGEGDDFFFIDGEQEPSLRGTGSEDYLCDAWGLRPISYPHYGVSVFEQGAAMDRTSAYRWHIADPVSFEKSLRVEIEHKGVTFKKDGTIDTHFGEREDDFSSVAFWYQMEPSKPFPPLPPAYERVYHDPEDLIESETLYDEGKLDADGGELAAQVGPWSGARQIQWHPTAEGQTLSLPFTVDNEADYDLTVFLTKAVNHGTFQVELDGQPIGKPIDLYELTYFTKGYPFKNKNLTPGEHKLTLRLIGHSRQALGLSLGLDCLLLTERSREH